MKLLADQMLLSGPVMDGDREIYDALRLPGTNHAPIGNDAQPMCERFVFDREAVHALGSIEGRWGDDVRRLGGVPIVLDRMWIEADVDNRCRVGWLIRDDVASCVVHFTRLRTSLHVGDCMLSSFADHRGSYCFTPAGEGFIEGAAWSRGQLYYTIVGVIPHLLALASPRAATSRRILPGAGLDKGVKAFALRRAQRGVPVFSYNRVELVRPQTAMYRGEVRTAESVAGMRLHQVIGHWRLIDGVIEPYWIWIDGHERGDEKLGTIVKERHVRLDRGGMRRGFRLPAYVGRPGERVVAR